MRIRAAACLAVTLMAGLPLRASVPPPANEDEFKEEIDVRISTIVLRVVDGRGEPVRGLEARDFRVQLGKKEITVVAVDWVSSTEPAPASKETPSPAAPAAEAPAPAPVPAGKLVVVFVQADNNAPARTRGHLKTLPYVKKLLAGLDSGDRLAVVSFDSHLKLWQDFTLDRDATYAA